MKLTNYAFMVLGPGFDPELNTSVTESPEFKMTVVGVPTVDEACGLVPQLIEDGAQMIELCGGFDADATARVIDAIDGKVPVGAVRFSEAETVKLTAFFEK